MLAVLQRVKEASVEADGQIEGAIKTGLLILLGIHPDDTDEDIKWLSGKIVKMRIFEDENDLMNLSVKDINGDLLVISQFTLFASTKKGNRPSYLESAKPEIAIPLYEKFLNQLSEDFGKEIEKGIFGANMQVSLINDGPVTINIDSKNKK